jgi:dimethylargininase
MFNHAIARKPGPNFAQGLTISRSSEPADYYLILQQHVAYVEKLKYLGLEVIVLDPLPDYPDAYFVEDIAVVTDDIAVITNPGAKARQGEEESIARVLAGYRKIEHIHPPGTVDGGDVLQIGNHFFIGRSQRTNQEGADQLGRILQRHGNTWTAIPVREGLHFKSSVNYVGRNTLLVTENFVKHQKLKGFDLIVVNASEEHAANTLLVNDHLLMPGGYPRTRRKLESLALEIIELDTSELLKMDGGLTCMSIRFYAEQHKS